MFLGKKITWNERTQEFLIIGLVLFTFGMFVSEVGHVAIKTETVERWQASGARLGLYFAEGSSEVGGHWLRFIKDYGQEVAALSWQAPAVAVDFGHQVLAIGAGTGATADRALASAADSLAPSTIRIQQKIAKIDVIQSVRALGQKGQAQILTLLGALNAYKNRLAQGALAAPEQAVLGEKITANKDSFTLEEKK